MLQNLPYNFLATVVRMWPNEKCDLVKPSEGTFTEIKFYWNLWDYDICRKKIKTVENKFEVIIMLSQWSIVAYTELSDKALKCKWF